jgi:hypothetical protein
MEIKFDAIPAEPFIELLQITIAEDNTLFNVSREKIVILTEVSVQKSGDIQLYSGTLDLADGYKGSLLIYQKIGELLNKIYPKES